MKVFESYFFREGCLLCWDWLMGGYSQTWKVGWIYKYWWGLGWFSSVQITNVSWGDGWIQSGLLVKSWLLFFFSAFLLLVFFWSFGLFVFLCPQKKTVLRRVQINPQQVSPFATKETTQFPTPLQLDRKNLQCLIKMDSWMFHTFCCIHGENLNPTTIQNGHLHPKQWSLVENT